MAENDGNFLNRWSRRKLEAKGRLAPKPADNPSGHGPKGTEARSAQPIRQAEPRAAAEAADREPNAGLGKDDFADVDFDALDHTSDYTRFMGASVPDAIRSKALHKLWLSDPILSKAEELDDYAADFTDAACTVPGKMIETAYKAGRGYVSGEDASAGATPPRAPVPEAAAAPVFAIAAEPADQPEVHALLAQSDAYARSLYPPESNHLVDVATLSQPNVRFFVARRDGTAIGCGSIMLAGDGSAEIKRMFVAPEARGRGAGRRILERLIEAARAEGVSVLRLETGVKQPEAIGLYRAAGFEDIGPFGGYAPDPLSLFMEKRLA